MKRKLILIGLSIIVIASILEAYLYLSKSQGVSRLLPTVSEIFSPVLLGQYNALGDESKTFYSERLNEFVDNLNPLILSKSSFVKIAEANYVVGGKVVDAKPFNGTDGSVSVGYDIKLRNSSEDTYVEHIDPIEAQYAKVFVRTTKLNEFSRGESALSEIKTGDYLVIKRSTNLLNPAEVNIEIEILRTRR